ncbi:hypothetical protein BDR26DRAFT_857666 [Obelidium mucronatum]|nr:hypothetical protein BDR26DRAFT_857666 [Obelidium mucronatum]
MLKRMFSSASSARVQFLLVAKDFTDADSLARRLAVRQCHLDRALQSKKDGTVLLGGATLNQAGNMDGSMLVLDFPSAAVADAYVKTDPYIVGKVWQSYTLTPFKMVAVAETAPDASKPQFLCIAKDHKDGFGKRMAALEAHRAHFSKGFESGRVVAGGPTLSSAKDSNSGNGSMFVFSAASKAEVEQHVQADPFATENVWESYDIVSFKLAPLAVAAPSKL